MNPALPARFANGGAIRDGHRLVAEVRPSTFPGVIRSWRGRRWVQLDPHDLDQVGVTLERHDNGYFIAGVAEKDGHPTVEGVRAGTRCPR